MNASPYVAYFLIGFVLVLLGAVLPFLMVLQVLKSTFFLNFLSYGATVSGILLGVIASTQYVREHRGKN
jgi:hypothetical protein